MEWDSVGSPKVSRVESTDSHEDEPTSCPCDNETLQTSEHILHKCTRYSQHRNILRKVSNPIALPVMLGTSPNHVSQENWSNHPLRRPKTTPPTPSFEDEPEPETAAESTDPQPEDRNEKPSRLSQNPQNPA